MLYYLCIMFNSNFNHMVKRISAADATRVLRNLQACMPLNNDEQSLFNLLTMLTNNTHNQDFLVEFTNYEWDIFKRLK